MYEVYMRLQFDSPCLGSTPDDTDDTVSRMRRGPNGNVIFSQTWWRTIICQGAESYSKHQERVKSVLWTPNVDGTTKMYRRHYKLKSKDGEYNGHIMDHESFLSGDIIGVKALVPDDISLEDLKDIMSLAGEYFGISPFGWKKGFGKFKVLELSHTRLKEQRNGQSKVVDQGESTGDNTSNS